MNTINNPSSRKSICNLLSDFILQKIGLENNTIVQVTDCINFFVINGQTENKKEVDTHSIIDDFNETYKKLLDKPITHTFDFIRYGSEMNEVDFLRKKFFITSDNTSYHYSLVEKFKEDSTKSYFYNGIHSYEEKIPPSLSVASEFPHGFSLKQGRSLHYYGKLISYNLSGLSLCTEVELGLYLNKNDLKQKYIDVKCKDFDETHLQSYILDSFDFNYEKLAFEITKEDLTQEVLNPLNEFTCVRNNLSPDPFI